LIEQDDRKHDNVYHIHEDSDYAIAIVQLLHGSSVGENGKNVHKQTDVVARQELCRDLNHLHHDLIFDQRY